MSPLITPEKPPVRLLDIQEVQEAIETAWDEQDDPDLGYILDRVAELLS